MYHKQMNATFGISTQMFSKKVVSYPHLKQNVCFVNLCSSFVLFNATSLKTASSQPLIGPLTFVVRKLWPSNNKLKN